MWRLAEAVERGGGRRVDALTERAELGLVDGLFARGPDLLEPRREGVRTRFAGGLGHGAGR